MQTNIHPQFKHMPEMAEAEEILRNCVHCGFCTATCPTYQELFDERVGSRGRSYLMKHLLEGGEVSTKRQRHLDRCLTCRSCETTCPSGVQYGRLVDIGRGILEKNLTRDFRSRFIRWSLRQVLPYKNRFGFLLKLGQIARPVMPSRVKKLIPQKQPLLPNVNNQSNHSRVMLALDGCAQPSATPNTLIAATNVLDKLGIQLITTPTTGCCGAVSYHLNEHEEGLGFFKRNIDAWWPAIEQGAEAIVITASGCGAMVKEYGHLLKNDKDYAAKAAKVSELAKDISEIIAAEDLTALKKGLNQRSKLAIHCPCTLQHAQQLNGLVDDIFLRLGFDLAKTKDKHMCCGSAGTYSILQKDISQKLLHKKLDALTIDAPDLIATANVGCQLHLSTESKVPVCHWIELLAQDIEYKS